MWFSSGYLSILLSVLLVLLLVGSIDSNSISQNNDSLNLKSIHIKDNNKNSNEVFGKSLNYRPPAYYINLPSSTERREYMERHLSEVGFASVKRINALTAKTCNLIMLESSCHRRVGFHEIAIVCSHLHALYEAIVLEDREPARNSPYALILEDDVRFDFDINFNELVAAAPAGFTMIQLLMSHSDHIEDQLSIYLSTGELFGPRYRNSTVWSAQAILVNKEAMRSFVMNAVRPHQQTKKLGYIISGSYHYNAPNDIYNPYKPSVASQCVFSDMFLYSAGQPAYILNYPLMNGAGLGLNSSSHSTHVPFHIHGFAEIEKIQSKTLSASTSSTNSIFIESSGLVATLPPFASLFPQNKLRESFNWTALAAVTKRPIYPGARTRGRDIVK